MTPYKALELTREAIRLTLDYHIHQEIPDQLIIGVLTDTLAITAEHNINDTSHIVERMADWMDEAADDIDGWGAYASEYFQNKHDLATNVLDFRTRATIIRKLQVDKVITISPTID